MNHFSKLNHNEDDNSPFSFILLNQQWKDFISRLEKLIYLSSQYEKIDFHQIDSPISIEEPSIHENFHKNSAEFLTIKNNVRQSSNGINNLL
ncbi:hypothetical protein I4U23_020330 [Adineta vaga]|nr:hypothetical protein I4U23_020330 [Adineta vaga]